MKVNCATALVSLSNNKGKQFYQFVLDRVSNWSINEAMSKKMATRQVSVIKRTPAKTKQRQVRNAKELASQKQYKTTSKRRKEAEQNDMDYISGKKAAELAAKIKISKI